MRGIGLIRLRIGIIGEPFWLRHWPLGSISHGVSYVGLIYLFEIDLKLTTCFSELNPKFWLSLTKRRGIFPDLPAILYCAMFIVVIPHLQEVWAPPQHIRTGPSNNSSNINLQRDFLSSPVTQARRTTCQTEEVLYTSQPHISSTKPAPRARVRNDGVKDARICYHFKIFM